MNRQGRKYGVDIVCIADSDEFWHNSTRVTFEAITQESRIMICNISVTSEDDAVKAIATMYDNAKSEAIMKFRGDNANKRGESWLDKQFKAKPK